MQGNSDDGLFRGADAIADYLNSRMIGGKSVTRWAVYRMINSGRLPATRLGEKGSEIWVRKGDLDRLLGIAAAA